MENQQYINGKVFAHLLETGGQSLVGVYAMLLKGRNGYHCYNPIVNKNNKVTTGIRLLSRQSNISITALKTHLPTIIEMGLGWYMNNGGFILLGEQKIKHKFHSYKKVPVRIGKNLRETKGNVNAVMIIANAYSQVSQIDKKITLNKLLRQEAKGKFPLTKGQISILKRAKADENVDLANLNKVENIVLSNQGISNLITGSERDLNPNSVSHGGYWRKVLQKRGFIHSRRRYKTIWAKKISYTEFLSMRNYFKELHGFVTYKNGRVVKPIVSEIMLPNLSIIDNSIYNTKYIIDNYNNLNFVEKTFLD